MPEPALRILLMVPTYNEAENIRPFVAAVLQAQPSVNIVIIDDNSPDGTGRIADELAAGDPRVRVLHRPEKAGLAAAYRDGYRYALDGEWDAAFEMDADFSHDPRYLQPMIEALADADVVVGSRYLPGGGTQDWGPVRRALSKGGGAYARMVLGLPVSDPTAGFIAFRRPALQALLDTEVRSNGYGFQIEVKYQLYRRGFRFAEVPIVFPDRREGDSKMTWDIAVEALWQVLRLRFRG